MTIEYNNHLVKVGDKLMVNRPVGIRNWRSLYYKFDVWSEIEVVKVLKTQFTCTDGGGEELRFSFSKFDNTASNFCGYGDNNCSAYFKGAKIQSFVGGGVVPIDSTDKKAVDEHKEKLNLIRSANAVSPTSIDVYCMKNVDLAVEISRMVVNINKFYTQNKR